MVDKTKYVERLKELHHQKKGVPLSDAEALDLFEKLVVLVGAVIDPLVPKEVIVSNYGK